MNLDVIQKIIKKYLKRLGKSTPTELSKRFQLQANPQKADVIKALERALEDVLEARLDQQYAVTVAVAGSSDPDHDLKVTVARRGQSGTTLYSVAQSLKEWTHASRADLGVKRRQAQLKPAQAFAVGVLAELGDESTGPDQVLYSLLNQDLVLSLIDIVDDQDAMERLHAAGFFADDMARVLRELSLEL